MERFRTLLIFAAVFISLKSVTACEHYQAPSICDAYAQAEGIFVGTPYKIVPIKNRNAVKRGQGSQNIPGSIVGYQVFIKVEKTYKGVPVTEIIAEQGMTSCDFPFKIGEKALLYGSVIKENGLWGINPDRSQPMENADEDLLVLKNLPQNLNRSRISGTIWITADPPNSGLKKYSGAKVQIQSNDRTYEVVTDRNGVYEILDLPPDNYRITPETPRGYKLRAPDYQGFGRTIMKLPTDETRETVSLKNVRCLGVTFVFDFIVPEKKLK